jgi:deoxyribonuclease V
MIIQQLHQWQVTPSAAISIQEQLASRVSKDETFIDVHFVAGVDVAIPRRGEGTASVVVLSYPELNLIEESNVQGVVDFPYIPGLLSFRESPLLIRAFEGLKITPDLVLVDGQGIAHPRRFGIAAHLGLLLDIPTIGCAKSRLCGTFEEPGVEAGCTSNLRDLDEVIGQVVRTKTNTRPVYVSIGHKISLRQAVVWTLRCCRGFRLPEPTRLAHQAAGGFLPEALQVSVK